MRVLKMCALIFLICCFSISMFNCSKNEKPKKKIGDKLADEVSNTLIKRPMDKTNRTKLLADLGTITRSIQIFSAEKGRYPKTLNELSESGYLSKVPAEPFGGKWLYDSQTGKVKSSSHPNIKPGQDL